MASAATPTPTALTPGPMWVNDHNYGPLVSIITWFLIITSFLSVMARVGTRLAVVKRVYADDITIMFALVSCRDRIHFFYAWLIVWDVASFGRTIDMCVLASHAWIGKAHGVAKPCQPCSFPKGRETRLAQARPGARSLPLSKESFSAELLYIVIITLIKISVCFYLTGLTPIRTQKTIVFSTGCFILLWGFSSIIVLGFQCHLPHTWDTLQGKCINIKAFWTYVDVMNIVTDLPLIILPAMIISRLQADTSRKAVVISCFASRVLYAIFPLLDPK